jgi:hypothetical protein
VEGVTLKDTILPDGTKQEGKISIQGTQYTFKLYGAKSLCPCCREPLTNVTFCSKCSTVVPGFEFDSIFLDWSSNPTSTLVREVEQRIRHELAHRFTDGWELDTEWLARMSRSINSNNHPNRGYLDRIGIKSSGGKIIEVITGCQVHLRRVSRGENTAQNNQDLLDYAKRLRKQ